MQKKKQLQVEWSAQSWPVNVEIKKRGGARLADARGFFTESVFAFWRDSDPPRTRPACLDTSYRWRSDAFTLVEMLVVIAVIAILAGLLLPALGRGKIQAKVKTAKSEMQNIATAISAYDTDYSRPPASKQAEASATKAQSDYTFGFGGIVNGPPHTYEANNSELMEILMAADRNVNFNHVRNPRKVTYFSPRQVSGDMHGLNAQTYVLRDPFGNPYIITLDMNDDNKVRDAYYSKAGVSERDGTDPVGYYGLSRPSAAAPFEIPGSVMIWTFGPDKQVGGASTKANADPNKDNILSWQ